MNDDHPESLATYRLQLNHEFRLTDVQSLVNYFSRLGITHLYASPIMRARAASTHGYDVVDPATINPTLGDKTDLVNLVTDLRRLGLGFIVDIVPNHMAASIENPYWRDVLTYGPSSPFSSWFDIDWRMPDRGMWGRVLVPVLGESLRHVLEKDQIQLSWSDGRFLVHYYDHLFPVDPASIPAIGDFAIGKLEATLGEDHPALEQIRSVMERLKTLPELTTRVRRRVDIDREETEQWLAELARQVVQSPAIQQWAEEAAREFSAGEAGRQRLRKLLDIQPYRLVHWRDAARAINYRRFFDINELISIRQEDPQVFQDTHAAVLRWIDDGLIDGLRIDHIDGLRDPLTYLQRLSEAVAGLERAPKHFPIFVEKILAEQEKLPCGWPVAGTTGYEFLNEVEAVLVNPSGRLEIEQYYRRMLRRPVQFADLATWGKRRVLQNELSPQVGRLADRLMQMRQASPQPVRPADDSPEENGDTEESPADDSRQADVALSTASPEMGPPADGARNEPAGHESEPREGWSHTAGLHGDLTKSELVDAIVEVVVALPVYRTYVDGSQGIICDADRAYVETALEGARQSGRAVPEAIQLLGEVLLLEKRHHWTDHELNQRVSFIQRFQQLTGPAAAKGIEDTALYAYVPLLSLNEVGGEPSEVKEEEPPLKRFHEQCVERARTWPQTMLCVTTHDTKRTADVRARLDVLSELSKLWTGLVRRWQQVHEPLTMRIRGKQVPDVNTAYLLYQTIVGIWPAPDPAHPEVLPSEPTLAELRERVCEYVIKAVREAKTHTSWTQTRPDFEEGVQNFARRLLTTEDQEEKDRTHFLPDLQHFVGRIARPGFWNSLTRTLLQYTTPGTPDLYQGDELWNFALVDPDNRRPVDFPQRIQWLDEVITGSEQSEEAREAFLQELVSHPEDGRIKLHLVRSALMARRDYPSLFSDAHYEPLNVTGPAAQHVIAFARLPRSPSARNTGEDPNPREAAAMVVVPRWTAILLPKPHLAPIGAEVWTETNIELPEALRGRQWNCLLSRKTRSTADSPTLPVAEALETFPAALLVSTK
jgi:(1->4)-alpha-D-glucan 1-alpha-D-glucosylmutase